jgi:transcriptional regulator with XRE-family HTH domain
MGIGIHLKELRKNKNMTLKQVGTFLGMTATAISCYENETRKPSHEIIQKLADLYETTTDNIIGVQNENTNFKAILSSSNLHWDGIPLREDELNFIKQFLELRIKDKEEEKKNRKSEGIG